MVESPVGRWAFPLLTRASKVLLLVESKDENPFAFLSVDSPASSVPISWPQLAYHGKAFDFLIPVLWNLLTEVAISHNVPLSAYSFRKEWLLLRWAKPASDFGEESYTMETALICRNMVHHRARQHDPHRRLRHLLVGALFPPPSDDDHDLVDLHYYCHNRHHCHRHHHIPPPISRRIFVLLASSHSSTTCFCLWWSFALLIDEYPVSSAARAAPLPEKLLLSLVLLIVAHSLATIIIGNEASYRRVVQTKQQGLACTYK